VLPEPSGRAASPVRRYRSGRRMKVKCSCSTAAPVGELAWARVTDVAKRRRQGLVVCRAALPFEGLLDACPSAALARPLSWPGLRASRAPSAHRRPPPDERARARPVVERTPPNRPTYSKRMFCVHAIPPARRSARVQCPQTRDAHRDLSMIGRPKTVRPKRNSLPSTEEADLSR
jgi:hypothetical protein